jgi:hypothetical protein
MMMALLPAGQAAADHAPEARDTDAVCESDNPNDYDSSFADVGSGPHWVNIVCMADYGITEGVAPDGTNYAPRRAVTRGQMSSFIVRFIEDYTDEEMPEGDPERFDDVPETDGQYVHATNIHKLAEADIVRGTNASGGDSFAPQQDVNRMQMGTFIRHALSWIDDGEARNESAPPPSEHSYFPDKSAPVHLDNVDAIAHVGIVEGFQDGTYGPTQSVLRDQMASYVMRAYDYAVTEGLGVVEPPPAGPGIDTAEVAFDAFDSEGDTGTVSMGDTWTLEFSDTIDTFATGEDMDTGVSFTLEAGDTPVTFTVQCDLGDGVDEGNTAATCEIDEDGALWITLLDSPTGPEGEYLEYPAEIVGTDLVTEDGEEIDLENSADTTLEVDGDTPSGPIPNGAPA